MANIGEIIEEIEVVPLSAPVEQPAPSEQPAVSPDRELVPTGA